MIKFINAINYPRGLLYTTPEVSGQRKSTISPSRINWRPGTSAIDASAMMTILLRYVNIKDGAVFITSISPETTMVHGHARTQAWLYCACMHRIDLFDNYHGE